MRAVELLRAIRDGGEIQPSDIDEFIKGVKTSAIPDYQVSAFLMAIYFRGLAPQLTAQLTLSMRDSGAVLDWEPEHWHLYVDKHSTGGVGDKISLALAPLAAACGLKVPMISGRGLGHTGGTLDKLESIAGFRTNLSLQEMRDQVNGELSVAMVGQTDEIAPVDRLMYALRDVTATVESVPLIASSILSKKLASGISGLVLDLKVGSGAFMKTKAEAQQLAQAISEIANHVGLKLCVVITNMSQPLGEWVGNYVELIEAAAVLSNPSKPVGYASETREMTIELTSEMVCMAKNISLEEARRIVTAKLENGEALRKFELLIEKQGGHWGPDRFSSLEQIIGQGIPVKCTQSGYISAIDTQQIGRSCMELGGGRATASDKINYNVGIKILRKIGDKVSQDDVLAEIYPDSDNNEASIHRAVGAVQSAYFVSDEKPKVMPLILSRIRNY